MNNKIRDDFPPKLKTFFQQLQNYLDTDLNFYGSVNRSDYVHGKSDIDVAIFTENEYSTMAKLQHFLHVSKKQFEKIVWKLEGVILYGYKIKYQNGDILCEIAIYNNDFKDMLIQEMTNQISFSMSILLYLLKTLHYTLGILSQKTYSDWKRYLFNKVIKNKQNTVFAVLHSDDYKSNK